MLNSNNRKTSGKKSRKTGVPSMNGPLSPAKIRFKQPFYNIVPVGVLHLILMEMTSQAIKYGYSPTFDLLKRWSLTKDAINLVLRSVNRKYSSLD